MADDDPEQPPAEPAAPEEAEAPRDSLSETEPAPPAPPPPPLTLRALFNPLTIGGKIARDFAIAAAAFGAVFGALAAGSDLPAATAAKSAAAQTVYCGLLSAGWTSLCRYIGGAAGMMMDISNDKAHGRPPLTSHAFRKAGATLLGAGAGLVFFMSAVSLAFNVRMQSGSLPEIRERTVVVEKAPASPAGKAPLPGRDFRAPP